MKLLSKIVFSVGFVAAFCFTNQAVCAQSVAVEKSIEKHVKSRAANVSARSYKIVEITKADIDGDGDEDTLVNYSVEDIDREAASRRVALRGYEDLNGGCRSGACAFIAVFINKKQKLRYQTEVQAGYDGQVERAQTKVTSVSNGVITLETVIEKLSPQDKRVLGTSRMSKDYKLVDNELKVSF